MLILVSGTNNKAKPHSNGVVKGMRSSLKRMSPVIPLLLLFGATTTFAANSPKVLTTRAEPRTGKTVAEFFTSVKPIYNVVVRSSATGTLEDIHVMPGDHVVRGEQLGRLGGATYSAVLVSARASAKMATRTFALAQDQLEVDKSRYPLLVNRSVVDQGKLKIARERNKAIQERAALSALQKHGILTSPATGTITRVISSNGERVSPGEKLLVIQPSKNLWLVGNIYAREIGRIRLGMLGEFHPTSGGTPIPVRVTRIFPQGAGKGLGVGLEATAATPHWFSGEGGMVKINTPAGSEPAVPDSALVLNEGQWWVIKSSNGHLKPVRVVPDGSMNGWTWISAGLKPGTPVVTSNAYLIFHQSFAKKYSGH